MSAKTHYEFINAQTGNVIGYLALPVAEVREHVNKLTAKRLSLADTHQLNLNLIYWQDKNFPI